MWINFLILLYKSTVRQHYLAQQWTSNNSACNAVGYAHTLHYATACRRSRNKPHRQCRRQFFWCSLRAL